MPRSALAVRTLLASAAAFAATAEPLAAQDPAARVADLATRGIALRTLDPRDHDFADLEPLAAAIGAARIVVLGEATHSEGATSALKARLAIFLHQRMGFDVLAWEAGVADCAALNAKLRDPSVPLHEAKRQMMRGGWDAIAETQPLFEHARASWRTALPLEMAGFDGERPPHGSRHLQERIAALDAVLGLALTDADRAAVRAFADRTAGFLGSGETVDADARAHQRDLIEGVREALLEPAAAVRLSPRQRGHDAAMLAMALAGDEWKHRAEHGPRDDLTAVRDRAMAAAFRELAEHTFAGRRIIVWAATAHLTRNTTTLEPLDPKLDYRGAEHMGDTVFADFGADLYTIAVTSHHGETGIVWPASANRAARIEPVEPPVADSFEDLAHRTAKPLLFVDLRGAPAEHWLRDPCVARPLGFIATRARWPQVVDAFLFVDAMQPEHRLDEPQ